MSNGAHLNSKCDCLVSYSCPGGNTLDVRATQSIVATGTSLYQRQGAHLTSREVEEIVNKG